MVSIGTLLRETREESGVSITEASSDLEVKDVVLENIEAGKIGAFKDVFELKEILETYAIYLGLDEENIIDRFNEYMFEYTSKIPVRELEKQVEENKKGEDKKKVVSPYTKEAKKIDEKIYIFIYILIIILITLAVLWALKQVTMEHVEMAVINYVK